MIDKLHEIRVFENYDLILEEAGHIVVSTEVVDKSLNYYGNAHGGYLFTLCDQVAGLTCLSLGSEAVTMQSNIHYMRAGRLGDFLTIDGTCLHNGRKTKVVEVVISNQAGEAVAQASFTMFVTGEREMPASQEVK
ncbi:PaaI family thioesterase [Streptococcus pluranimalium]|uniref:Thioesterase n=2 Tax=Streptococcus TaxID=1301 RepID=V6Z3F2_STRAG|nr:PaaI family thioesterase [Streptococcus acidominimus]ESV55455.1 thioesterase [Streptococcus agalactiae LMG 14747]SNV42441.1 Phenylacetic acid degradation protein PaaD,thioesterase [Streptococcus acidominimus]